MDHPPDDDYFRLAEEDNLCVLDKQSRTNAFNDPSKGKRRRRIQSWANKFDLNVLDRGLPSSFTHIGYNSNTRGEFTTYEVTPLDFTLPLLNLKADIDRVRQELMQHAKSYHVMNKQDTRDVRRCEVFDVEVCGVLRPPQAELLRDLSQTEASISAIRPCFKPGRYYQMRTEYALPKKRAAAAAAAASLEATSSTVLTTRVKAPPLQVLSPYYFAQFVKPVRMPPPAVVKRDQGEDVLVPRKVSFLSPSPRCYQLAGTLLHAHTQMVDGARVTKQIALACARSNARYEHRDSLCWASSPPPTDEFDDWYCEFDFGPGAVQLKAVLMQGRPPKLVAFPCVQHFESHETFLKFGGLTYPCLAEDSITSQNAQWVELFRVQIRQEKGKWMDLGQVFKANSDCITEERVNLPLNVAPCRYVRIQPLSRNKGGFHGASPAMRCSLVGVSTGASPANLLLQRQSQSDAHELEDGCVRYTLRTPSSSVHGYQVTHNRRVHSQGSALDYVSARTGCSCCYGYGNDFAGRRFRRNKYLATIIAEGQQQQQQGKAWWS